MSTGPWEPRAGSHILASRPFLPVHLQPSDRHQPGPSVGGGMAWKVAPGLSCCGTAPPCGPARAPQACRQRTLSSEPVSQRDRESPTLVGEGSWGPP